MSYSGNFVDKSKIENNLGSCYIDGFGNTIVSETLTTIADIAVGGGDITYGLNQDANLKISPVSGADVAGKKLTISGGQGTGAGLGGDLEFKTATQGVAGSNPNTLTTKMIIKEDGKVGVNDTSPISELSVAGRLALTAEQGTPTAPTDGNGWLYSKSDGKIYWQSFDVAETDLTSGGGGGATELNDLTDVSYTSGDLVITSLDTITYANSLDANLNVAPASGTNIDGKQLILKGGQGTGTGDGGSIVFETADGGTSGSSVNSLTEKMRILDDGNVGIGSENPLALVHLRQPAQVANSPNEILRLDNYELGPDGTDQNLIAGHGPAITFYVPEGNPPTVESGHGGTIAVLRESNTDTNNTACMAFYTAVNDTSPTEKMRITSDGNVGIGIKIPPNVLSTSPIQYSTGTASQSGNTITGSGTTFTSDMVGSQFVFDGSSQTLSAGTITGFTNTTTLTVSTSQTVSSQTYKIHHQGLQVNSDGNVGIGTASPDANLHIVDTGVVEGKIIIENENLALLQLHQPTSNKNYNIELGRTDGELTFRSNSGEQMRIKENGYVGLDEPSPTSILHINDRDVNLASGSNLANGIGVIYLERNTSGGGWIFDANQLEMKDTIGYINFKSTENLSMMKGGGKLVVAQTSIPSLNYKLTVNGSIFASGYNDLSDDRIKYNEHTINPTDALNIIEQLTPKKYEKITNTGNYYGEWIPSDSEWDSVKDQYEWINETGLIAQDVRAIPELAYCVKGQEWENKVKHLPDQPDETIWTQTPLQMSYGNIFNYHISATKALSQKVKDLEARIQALENP